jgi:hypothetical protein
MVSWSGDGLKDLGYFQSTTLIALGCGSYISGSRKITNDTSDLEQQGGMMKGLSTYLFWGELYWGVELRASYLQVRCSTT